MGYTHYFEHKVHADNVQWKAFATFARVICDIIQAEGVSLDVTIDEEMLDVNGIGKDSHENLLIRREPGESFAFCKTAEKPYDKAVIAILAAARKILPGFAWSSDGGEEAISAGNTFLEKYTRDVQAPAEKPGGTKRKKGKAPKVEEKNIEEKNIELTLTTRIHVDELADTIARTFSPDQLFVFIKRIDDMKGEREFTTRLRDHFHALVESEMKGGG